MKFKVNIVDEPICCVRSGQVRANKQTKKLIGYCPGVPKRRKVLHHPFILGVPETQTMRTTLEMAIHHLLSPGPKMVAWPCRGSPTPSAGTTS